MDLNAVIETLLVARFDILPDVMADTGRSHAERKIAQCVYFHRLSIISATAAYVKADALIAAINAWNVGKPGHTPRTRADFRNIRVGRTDIRDALEDGASEEAQAVEWMVYARSVAENPALVSAKAA